MLTENLAQIKAIYKSILGLISSVDPKSGYSVNRVLGENYDFQVDQLTSVTRTDYSRFKVVGRVEVNEYGSIFARDFVSMLSQLAGELEGRYDFDINNQSEPHTVVTIDNSNRNQISIAFKSINQVISEFDDPEVISKLAELNQLLASNRQDVGKIQKVLVWLADKSWEAFLAVLPYLLDKLGTKI